ncbi:family 10 glycosylhydrolase [Paenibacillus sp. WST5]|uniref:Family 10 glycosylhydrolase n=1 Tax=Paenibacillus sedimenti TaxID=2770274 RepID=A0A926QGS8_9BACL|nr:family 10 glycosylhydrolase [Paenibacillus sedimenti]
MIPFLTALIFFTSTFISGFSHESPTAYADSVAEINAASSPAYANVENFEQTTNLSASSAQAKSVSIGLISRPETIYYGYHAVKLAYDFTGMTGTSAAYINFKDPSGTAGRTLQGVPKKLGVWVFGDGNNHWLRAQLQDATGTKTAVDFTSSNGLNWTGWKYVTIAVPSTLKAPLKINQIYVVETKENNKNSGVLYFDQLNAFYSDSTVFGLDVVGLPPMQVGDTKQAAVNATYQNSTEPVPVLSGITYRSSDERIATIDAGGTVRALQAGTVTIAAAYGNAPEAAYTLTVTAEAPIPQKLELSALSKLETGATNRLRVYATYSGAADPVTIASGAAFQCSSPDIATVDASGLIKAVKPGTTTITASYSGVSLQYVLTVTNPVPVLQSIALTGLKAMTVGESRQTKVFGTYTWLPESVELTSGVTFISSNPGIASVSASGTVTALQMGTSRITVTYGGKSNDFYLVVNKVATVPKRELRAAWIATVDNIDWPKKGVVEAEAQKREFIELLDVLQEAGMNAVIVQVKPTADAFYPSAYAPWSEWLTGQQGKDPGYNPLAFMLEEVHKRNMEFHAWFNPYRISLQDRIDKLVPNHPARLHPDWVVTYGGKLYFNPGIPEAKQFITDSIMEVVKNYDIDAVHFDDYFYPYPVTGVDFPDQEAYSKYGSSFPNKGDWRRSNVNAFVQEMNAAIKQEKSWVKFGISPFGIWKNKNQDPSGSDTNGLSSYDAIYADTKKWVDQAWIDYVAPQIYWYMGYSPASYDKLIEWWSGVTAGKNVHLYSGQAVYRIGSADPAWQNPDEMPNQVAYNRNFNNVHGSIFFSSIWFKSNPLGFTDRLKTDFYRYPALVPAMPWLDQAAPDAPVLASAVRKASGIEVTWKNDEQSDTAYYVIYRFDGAAAQGLQDPTPIIAKVRKQSGTDLTYVDKTATDGNIYTYVVTAIDRIHNESAASNSITMTNILDVTPPVSAAAIEGTQNNGWYVSEVRVQLSANDDLTGVKQTEFSTDNGSTWNLYVSPISLSADGVHTLLYRSTDNAGNVEQPQTAQIPIDRTAPTIQINGAMTYTVDQTVSITCTAADTVSGIVYNPCAQPLVSAPAYQLELGTHDVTVQVTDRAGNTGTRSESYTVQVTENSIASLIGEFVTGPGEQGIENSLLKKLEHRQTDALIHEINAQTGNRITAEQAGILIKWIQALQ